MYTLGSAQKCCFQSPIASSQPVTDENRFGASLQVANAFRYRLTHTIRNEKIVRARWEVEWQTPLQSAKANAFLYEIMANKELLQQAITRTELRPLPAQWKHLMKALSKAKVFEEFIQLAHSKSL